MCEQTLIHTCSQEYPGSARCVQSFDDSLDSAIRITYRISLRSSSMREPRHPSLKVVWHSVSPRRRACALSTAMKRTQNTHPRTRLRLFSVSQWRQIEKVWVGVYRNGSPAESRFKEDLTGLTSTFDLVVHRVEMWYGCFRVMNDPTAGSPTVTLLRLHLPLNDEVWANSHGRAPMKVLSHDPETSPNHSIGRCDGRCVQRAGT